MENWNGWKEKSDCSRLLWIRVMGLNLSFCTNENVSIPVVYVVNVPKLSRRTVAKIAHLFSIPVHTCTRPHVENFQLTYTVRSWLYVKDVVVLSLGSA